MILFHEEKSFILMRVTCGSAGEVERIFAFPWQQRLLERFTTLLYTDIACRV